MIKPLNKVLQKARKKYHSGDGSESPLTDQEFDALEKLAGGPGKKVGAPVMPTVRKVRLPVPMGSLQKVKPDGSANAWLKENAGDVTISDKIDGASSLIEYTKSGVAMYSRGNGTVGQDITGMLDHVKGVGKKLGAGTTVRGELVMHKSDFAKYAKDFANPRNLVSGIVNSKSTHAATKNVTFVLHQIIKPKANLYAYAAKLKSAGWNVVHMTKVKSSSLDETVLLEYLERRRKLAKYEMDGLVLTSKSGASIAFKGKDTVAAAIVDHVEWTASQYGLLKPVVILKKPVLLDGVSIKRVTAHNARMVKDLKIGPDAVITIIRSGQVIPKITKVVSPGKNGLPKGPLKWDGVDLVAPNSASNRDLLATKKLARFLAVLGVENISEGLVSALVDNGINSPRQLLSARINLLAEVLGPSRAPKLVKDLHAALGAATHITMMKASGVFGKGWGETKITKILETYTPDQLVKMGHASAIEKISSIGGLSENSAEDFLEGLPQYTRFIQLLGWEPTRKKTVKGRLSGTVWVFTGGRDKSAEKRIKELGGRVANSVTSETTYLVTYSKTSTKLDKARKLGTKIVSPDSLSNLLR